ncbi:Lrp/AsnC family transcriptional regulator [Candidatus Bipolaricaulota bacterium]|nr:Lrp/AsnC family transcriptional regulator [Candidatus Bipolaricaulota bacterium]
MKLRDRDVEILRFLDRDSRMSLRHIAKELEVSPTTVSNRVQKMKDAGVIKKFNIKVDFNELDYSLTAIIKVKAKSDDLSRVLEELEHYDCLTHIYETTGDFDVISIGKFKSRKEMTEQLVDLVQCPHVDTTNTSLVLSTLREYENSGLI